VTLDDIIQLLRERWYVALAGVGVASGFIALTVVLALALTSGSGESRGNRFVADPSGPTPQALVPGGIRTGAPQSPTPVRSATVTPTPTPRRSGSPSVTPKPTTPGQPVFPTQTTAASPTGIFLTPKPKTPTPRPTPTPEPTNARLVAWEAWYDDCITPTIEDGDFPQGCVQLPEESYVGYWLLCGIVIEYDAEAVNDYCSQAIPNRIEEDCQILAALGEHVC
jgi:hypothetical protein